MRRSQDQASMSKQESREDSTSSLSRTRRRADSSTSKPFHNAINANGSAHSSHGGNDASSSLPWPSSIPLQSLFAVLYYVLTSTSLTLLNKTFFTTYSFTNPALLLTSQSFISITAIQLISRFNTNDKSSPSNTNPNFPLYPIRHLLHPSNRLIYILFALSHLCTVYFSLTALSKTSLTLYHTLRRTSILFVLYLQCTPLPLFHLAKTPTKRPSTPTICTVLIITIGAILTAAHDLAFDLTSFLYAILANLSGAIYLHLLPYIKSIFQSQPHHTPSSSSSSLSHQPPSISIAILYSNAVLTLVLSLPFTLLTILHPSPRSASLSTLLIKNPTFFLRILSNAVLAIILNHAIFLNTTKNSALTQCVAAQLKDLVLLGIGWWGFDWEGWGLWRGVGCWVGFLGGVGYGAVRYLEKSGKIREKKV